jgi:hypothetical protein
MCGAKRGEFGDAENDGVGGEEKSSVAAARCFPNSRHERSQVREHDPLLAIGSTSGDTLGRMSFGTFSEPSAPSAKVP